MTKLFTQGESFTLSGYKNVLLCPAIHRTVLNDYCRVKYGLYNVIRCSFFRPYTLLKNCT